MSRDAEIYARSKAGPYDLAAMAKEYGVTPQRIGQVIAASDAKVYTAWRTGRFTLGDLAEEYHLTADQLGEILTARHPAFEDKEVGRGVLRSRLELLMVAVQEVIEHPGYKMTPAGRLAYDDDGKPLVDTTARIEALRLQLAAYERASKLDGRDEPVQTKVTHETAQQQADASIRAIAARMEEDARQRETDRRELEAFRQRFGQPAVIPGEVERPAIEG